MARLVVSMSRLPLSDLSRQMILDGHAYNFNILDVIDIENDFIVLRCSRDHINNQQPSYIEKTFRNIKKILEFLKTKEIYCCKQR